MRKVIVFVIITFSLISGNFCQQREIMQNRAINSFVETDENTSHTEVDTQQQFISEANYPCYALPAVVATDAAGAIVGAASSALAQTAVTGEVNLKVVGVSAVIGAVSYSTGVVGKVAGFIAKLF